MPVSLTKLSSTMKPIRTLLAEDDADDNDLFLEAMALVDPVIEVVPVENGEKLINHLKGSQINPDYIFLDLNMPKTNGKECLVDIRLNDRQETFLL